LHCGGRIQVFGLSWFSIIIFNSRFWSYSIHALTSTFRAYLRDSLLVRALSLPLILLTSRLHVMWKSKTAWTLVKLYWQVDLSHLHVPSIIFGISLIVNDYMHIVHYCEFFLAKLVILLGVASQTEESSSPSRKTWLKHLGS